MIKQTTFYDVLGVEPDASPEAIKAAWTAAMKANHPDATGPEDSGATRRTQLLNEAYDTLKNADRRAAYDAEIGVGARAATETETEPHQAQTQHQTYTSPSYEEDRAEADPGVTSTRRSSRTARRAGRQARWNMPQTVGSWISLQWVTLFSAMAGSVTDDSRLVRLLKVVVVLFLGRVLVVTGEYLPEPPFLEALYALGAGGIWGLAAAIPVGIVVGVFQARRKRTAAAVAGESGAQRRMVNIAMALNGILTTAVAVVVLAVLGQGAAFIMTAGLILLVLRIFGGRQKA